MVDEPLQASGDYRREKTSVVTWLICAIAGAFFLQFVTEILILAPGEDASGLLALSGARLRDGYFWPLLTHWLVHSTANLFHVGLVLAVLLLVGREVVGQLGPRWFVTVFGMSILAGAAAWCAIQWDRASSHTGAVAGAYGLLTIHALQNPSRESRILLFFAFPLVIRPRQILLFLILLESSAFLFLDVFGQSLPFEYAPSAHLGGILTGWACFRLRQRPPFRAHPRGMAQQAVDRLMTAAKESNGAATEAGPGHARSPSDLRSEIDRILDKISSGGLASLTDAERKTLDEAKESLHRR